VLLDSRPVGELEPVERVRTDHARSNGGPGHKPPDGVGHASDGRLGLRLKTVSRTASTAPAGVAWRALASTPEGVSVPRATLD
jgi:hypothetical protein